MISIIAWFQAMFFVIWETSYFGGNMFPKTDAEVVCDGIALILGSFALLIMLIEQSFRKAN